MSFDLDSRCNLVGAFNPGRAFVYLLGLVVLGILVSAPRIGVAQQSGYGYFTITPDLRLCPSPDCGGFHLRALNQGQTTCADGTLQTSCYVATADFGILESPVLTSEAEVVVRGRIETNEYPFFGNLGRFVVESAWTGSTSQAAIGSFYRMRDLGIVCVTTPCFSIEGRILNQTPSVAFSKLDLSGVDASPAELTSAQVAIHRGELLVAGTTGPDPGPAGEGLALSASQFWLPVASKPRCGSSSECALGTTCNAVDICLPLPECEPGDSCPAVCSGYCEAALCEDLAGYDFGPCDAVLGWGVIGGACIEVSGCDSDPFILFASSETCSAACVNTRMVPLLGQLGTMGLGLGLAGLAVAWLKRRKSHTS
jgi:hypothetical protein